MRGRLIVALTSISAVACSVLVSTSDLTGGSPLDAGSDAAALEGGVDGNLPIADGGDASNAGDVASLGDGNTPVDSGNGGPFCPLHTGVAFCSDFDLSTNLVDGWTFPQQSGFTPGDGGVAELDPNVFVSPHTSGHVSVPSAIPGSSSGLVNRIGWNPPSGSLVANTFHVELQLRIDSLDRFASAYLFGFELGTGYSASVRGSRMATSLEENVVPQAGSVTTIIPSLLPLNTWLHIEIDIDAIVPVGTAPVLTIKSNGALLVTKTLAPGYSSSLTQVDIGPRYYSESMVDATSMHFDNVLVDAK